MKLKTRNEKEKHTPDTELKTQCNLITNKKQI